MNSDNTPEEDGKVLMKKWLLHFLQQPLNRVW